MATHDWHEGLPGYTAESFLHDGCGECDHRANQPLEALLNMEEETFASFWRKMLTVEWGSAGGRWTSANDAKVGRQAYFIALLLQRQHTLMVVPGVSR